MVSLTDGETVLLRLPDVDPDLVIADVFLPARNGFEETSALLMYTAKWSRNSSRERELKTYLEARLQRARRRS